MSRTQTEEQKEARKKARLTSDRIQDALYGFARSQLLFSAIDLKLFSAISDGHDTVASLAPLLQADTRALRIFLDGLVGIGFLEKDPDAAARYALPPDVAKFLVKSSPDNISGMVKHCKRLYENWTQLTDVVRTGQPAGGAQVLAHIEAYFSELVKGLYVSNYPTARHLARVLGIGDELKNLNILDVAGGSAVWSIAMLERDKNSRATLLDYPMVIDVGREYVDKHALNDRFEFLPGDLEEMDFPKATYDLALLGNICHAIGPETVAALFCNVAQSLKPGGKIVIVDFVADDERAKAGWPLIFGVNMLITTDEGNVFTDAEYRHWLTKAGFSTIERYDLDSDVTVIVASMG